MTGLVAALVLLALVVWLQFRTRRFIQYLYFCRFPLLVAALLAGFPFAATRTGASGLLANLFWLDFKGLFLVTLLGLLVAWVVMVTVEIFLQNAHQRFRVAPVAFPAWYRWWLRPALFSPLAVPLIWTASRQSDALSLGEKAGAIGLGSLAGLASLGISFWIYHRFRGRLVIPQRFRPAAGSRSPFDGYAEPGTGKLLPGHVTAASFLLVTLGFYFFYWQDGPVPAGLPALGYVLLAVLLAGWALPAVSFFLDRYRVPVLLLLITGSFLLGQATETDHYFEISAPTLGQAAPAPSPAEAFRRDESEEAVQRQYPIVVVAASGGGITASLWTATVLTSLQEAAGPELTRNIRLISAVSGGSVGAMHFLDRFSPEGYPAPGDLQAIREAAGRSSLDSAAWGLAYPDLWRAFPGFVRNPLRDRGWAMEQAWRSRMLHPEATLGEWRRKVEQGVLPPVVFNSTEVETGRQFLLTPLAGAWRGRFFSAVYPGHDIPVSTAARLSATFPWVSPITRACVERCGEEKVDGVHLADGGYFDNFGVVTVINWMRSLSPAQREEMRAHGVLLVLIRAFPGEEPNPLRQVEGENRGWLYATVGPILTMSNVRNAAQDDRNVTELSLLSDLLGRELGGKLRVVSFNLQEKSPLSWKLTEREAGKILGGIGSDPANRRSLAAVREIFERRGRANPPRPPGPGSGPGDPSGSTAGASPR